MNNRRLIVLICFVLAFLAVGFTRSKAKGGVASITQATLGSGFTYQGHLTDGGEPANGVYDFEFTLYDAEEGGENLGVYLVEDVLVENGLFSVQLDFGPDVFDGNARWLMVGVRPGGESGEYTPLDPRQAITPAPYALYAVEAHTIDGLLASELGTHYQQVVVVAKSGGDFTSVQAAIDSISDATALKPYLVWVAPGLYIGQVTMKPHVHLQGAGQDVAILISPSSNDAWPPIQGTLILASNTSVKDLTVRNLGSGAYNVALLATSAVTNTLVADVTSRAQGNGVYNYGVVFADSSSEILLEGIKSWGENGSNGNYGFYNSGTTMLQGSSFTGRGGTDAWGIYNNSGTLETEGVSALGENASDNNYGLRNYDVATGILRGGSFTGRGGSHAYGIFSSDSDTRLETENVTLVGENASDNNFGLMNYGAAALRGGYFTGRGGINAYGINSSGIGTILETESVNALGENGSENNYGLSGYGSAMLSGGSFTGRGGSKAHGIYCYGSYTLVEADGVVAVGENGLDYAYGLKNVSEANVILHGGSFTGWGGFDTFGIYNSDSYSRIEAEGVVAVGEDGYMTIGLGNYTGGTAILRGGSFSGLSGVGIYGIYNYGSGTTLEAENVSVLGEHGYDGSFGLCNYAATALLRGGSFTGRDGYSGNSIGIGNYQNATLEAESVNISGEEPFDDAYGLSNDYDSTATLTQSVLSGETHAINLGSGAVTVSNSRLVGGAVSGGVTCVLVTRNTTISTDGSTCP